MIGGQPMTYFLLLMIYGGQILQVCCYDCHPLALMEILHAIDTFLITFCKAESRPLYWLHISFLRKFCGSKARMPFSRLM